MSNNNILNKVLISVLIVAIILLFGGVSLGDLTGSAVGFPGWGFCSSANPCNIGEGDCDSSDGANNRNDCQAGLVCNHDVGSKYYGVIYSRVDVCEKSIERSSNRTDREVPLGSSFVERVGDLKTVIGPPSNYHSGVSVQTSLTGAEDVYQTDVALEIAKDAIKYGKSVMLSQNFDFLGRQAKVLRTRQNGAIIIEFDRQTITANDGAAFVGEDKDDPNWVWDLQTSADSNFVFVGIENDFVYNDPTDKLPTTDGTRVECVFLPFSWASVCLDGLTVGASEYDTYTIEYEPNVDLSRAGGSTSEPTVRIKTSAKIELPNRMDTHEMWITGDGRVYYIDNTNRLAYLRTVGKLDLMLTKDGLKLSISNDLLLNKILIELSDSVVFDSITMFFGVRDGKVYALGNTQAYEEYNEISVIPPRGIAFIGTKDEDHRNAYGIIIRDPKAHGSNDEVVLDIPKRQVKAKVSMSTGGTVSVPSTPGYVSCNAGSDCFLNVNQYTTLFGKNVKLVRVGSAGAIIVDVNGVTATLSSGSTGNINGVQIENKETFYDSVVPDKSSATLIISEGKFTTKGAVVCVKPDNSQGACISTVDENGRCECF